MTDGSHHRDEIDHRLREERPIPRSGYRGEIRSELVSLEQAGFGRPGWLWPMLATTAGAGIALLAVGLAGVLGAGPFAT